MKISAFFLVSGLLALAYTAQAQTTVKSRYKSDPGYSVHNYKHPHKAAMAKKHNLDNLITIGYIEPIQPIDLLRRNYKAQAVNMNMPLSGAVMVVADQPQYQHSIDSPADYKRQFRPRTSSTQIEKSNDPIVSAKKIRKSKSSAEREQH